MRTAIVCAVMFEPSFIIVNCHSICVLLVATTEILLQLQCLAHPVVSIPEDICAKDIYGRLQKFKLHAKIH